MGPRPFLAGRVLLGRDSVPVSGAEVTLHRITPDSGAAVGRTVTGPDGSFRLDLPGSPGEDAVWLATVRHDGVQYAGRAIHGLPSGPLEGYRIAVFGSAPADSIPVEARRLVVSARSDGLDVLDVLLLGNPSDVSVVPPRQGAPGWRVPLPAAATGVRPFPAGPGDPEMAAEEGSVRLEGAILPGGRRVTLRYRVRGSVLRLPSAGPAVRHEALVEGGRPARARRWVEVEGVDLEGTRYRRFVGAGWELGSAGVLELSPDGGTGMGSAGALLPWLFLGAGALCAAAAILTGRRAGDPLRTAEPGR